MDLDNKMTICYIMNKMAAGTIGNPRTRQYIEAVYEAIRS